ncbi:MAG TPA: TIGR03435 family protein [Bryobacteraceae bacterium]|jgi:uncharacterized protein (TIGR03435 family)|nr:TIGR03435 family protein [Bryobacteraceae bacterium]
MPVPARKFAVLFLALLSAAAAAAQTAPPRPAFEAFDVAAIKPTPEDARGRYIRMQSGHQFQVKSYTVRNLVGAAYDLTPRAVSGGPAWAESDRYDILAVTPGDVQPTQDEQMKMLRKLLSDRFQLTFHRETKELSAYVLTVAKGGSKLTESAAPSDSQPALISTVFPEKDGGVRLGLPARNATMGQFASILQRAIVGRPVVDRTGLTGKYDFQLDWKPDETQFDGSLLPAPNSTYPDFYAALQTQLGLRLEATRAPVDTVVIDRVERPTEN